MRCKQLIDALDLAPHPEGGYYREIFRSASVVDRLATQQLPVEANSPRRCALTSIYFLLQRDQVSRWHVVAADEAWHFYEGEPLELITYAPASGTLKTILLGSEAAETTRCAVVPAGTWQAARPLGAFALTGCTVGPGFEFEDFQFVQDLPAHAVAFAETLNSYKDLL